MDATLVYLVLFGTITLPVVSPASYNNCRSVRGDVLLYHRRIKQDPTRHLSLQFVSFPEILIDRPDPRDIKVISCILCNDLRSNQTDPTNSECKVLAGGVGHTFVKLCISAKSWKGYDFDVKLYGQKRKHDKK